MSIGNIIGGILNQTMSGQSSSKLQTGARNAEQGGGIEQMLESLLGSRSGLSGQAGAGGLADMAKDFLGKEQAGGMSGAKIGGLGALAGGLLGGGLGGAAKGGAMAVLGTLALKAWRDHQGQQGQQPAPTSDDVDALTGPRTERLVLQAMIGAAQADGQIDAAEMEKLLGRMSPDDATEEERQLVRTQVAEPVDLERLGADVQRPEVAMEVYLAALITTNIDTPAERDYLARLASALKLDAGMIERLHDLTGAPAPNGSRHPSN
ncbi:tellurite resistance TerB family protein [Polymorphobacter fuscus]|uniref:DUF533 domain-containing protein n=1 Tax=Sandarakinorhabdus fusca TaxID=1439888 RepID=A0A7C9LFX2_9SPHN|nr:tellurite resistance TerB family protein [Polymorphobacter fuscus]KAB7647714.1 tellurite resistance TerB family protein [Polymorphobacter fuscus]MQT17007.1 DUF533 domain-containing protein [Polymorphobacter fuscus]NJC09001.1 uncharacterized membrane protein YebE (DUF533 family) [Polymorphobacter fuscus]